MLLETTDQETSDDWHSSASTVCDRDVFVSPTDVPSRADGRRAENEAVGLDRLLSAWAALIACPDVKAAGKIVL